MSFFLVGHWPPLDGGIHSSHLELSDSVDGSGLGPGITASSSEQLHLGPAGTALTWQYISQGGLERMEVAKHMVSSNLGPVHHLSEGLTPTLSIIDTGW